MEPFFGPHLLLIRDGRGVAYDSALKRYRKGEIGADVVARHYLLHEHSFEHVRKRYEQTDEERRVNERWDQLEAQCRPEPVLWWIAFRDNPKKLADPFCWVTARAFLLVEMHDVSVPAAVRLAFAEMGWHRERPLRRATEKTRLHLVNLRLAFKRRREAKAIRALIER